MACHCCSMDKSTARTITDLLSIASINNTSSYAVYTLSPRQNGRHFADDVFKCVFVNKNICILITISLKCVRKSSINNIPTLVKIMVWRRSGTKPLSEPMMVSLLTHICVDIHIWPSGLCTNSYPEQRRMTQIVTSDTEDHIEMFQRQRTSWQFSRPQLVVHGIYQ